MGLIDSIIGVESGGNPNATLLQVLHATNVGVKLRVYRVVKLLFVSGPATIARLVVSAWVNAVNRVFKRRFGPHVCEKVLKASLPSLADLNAFRAVVSVTDVLGSGASLLHRAPSAIFGGFRPAVLKHGGSNGFLVQTPATLRPLRNEAVLSDNRSVPAIARAAIPAYAFGPAAVSIWDRFQFLLNNKASNSLPCQVHAHGS